MEQVVGGVCDNLGLRDRHTVVYICGNPDMILSVEGILMERGFPEFRVKKELYSPSASRPQWMRRAQAKDLTGSY